MLSCCGGHHQENSHQSQSSYHASKSRHWIMTLSRPPIVIVVLIVLIRAFQGEPTNNILIGILLICPLFHMIFTPLMNKIHQRRTSKE